MDFDLTQFAMPMEIQSVRLVPRTKKTGRFIKGPLPLDWVLRAANLPGSYPMKVAISLWYQAGLHRTNTVKVASRATDDWGVNCKARYRALGALEEVGLISVQREKGKSPVVTILDIGKDSSELCI